MSKICPQTGERVLYLECLECENRKECKILKKTGSAPKNKKQVSI